MVNMTDRQLCIGLSLSATWMNGKGWRRSDSDVENIYSSDFYIELAKMAEKAKLDFVFKPDTLFLNKELLQHSHGFGSLDPTILLSSIARETERIGLVTTASTTFNHPYVIARQLESLHWISNGRAGWNIVTSIEGAENFGKSSMPSSQERYSKAFEFTEVVQKLWASYPHEALAIDRVSGTFANGELVAEINHSGEHFSVKGPLNLPAPKEGSMPLFQAGASTWGRNFASSVADAIFAAAPDMESGIELRNDVRKRAVEHGRHPDAVRVLPGLYFFLGKTREEARDLHKETYADLSNARRYAAVQSILGIDVSHLPLEQPVTPDILPEENQPVRSQTHADLLRRLIINERPTVEELLSRPEVVGSAHWLIVGTVEDALQEISKWFEAGALDGFIALPGGSVKSMGLFFNELVPMLADKGLFRKEYSGVTLREHIRMT